MIEFFNTVTSINPIHAFLGFSVLCMMCGGGSIIPEEEDDNSDYDNASWNPASVNYNG